MARDAENTGRRIFKISGEVHSINHVANIVKIHTPDASIEFYPKTLARENSYDDGNAQQELGWHPFYKIEDETRDYNKEVRKRGPL